MNLKRVFFILSSLLFTQAAIMANTKTCSENEKTHAKIILLSNAQAGTEVTTAKPLDVLYVAGAEGATIQVQDAKGVSYVEMPVEKVNSFVVGGAIGQQTVLVLDKKGNEVSSTSFIVDAQTYVGDGGHYESMFDLFRRGMYVYNDKGRSVTTIDGKDYHHYIWWALDHNHTMKGMRYFDETGGEFVDLFKISQLDNGMIYSNCMKSKTPLGQESMYPDFCSKRYGDHCFIRQNTENHVEYCYANIFYSHWQATGDEDYLRRNIESVARALDYDVTDKLRWSEKYKLLKRAYTIDSWDFQIDSEHTPQLGFINAMQIDAEKTHFGIFFGDNTGYVLACTQLSEMYAYIGDDVNAKKYATRAKEIKDRLDKLSWNGEFYTHRIEEDDVDWGLDVDEKSQIAQGNMYSLNTCLTHEQSVAIINTYLNLKDNLPEGSPGEWYAIYPPFDKGFSGHNAKWQYMNGGVAGHAVGELAKGAYENGYEEYATDILNRLYNLGKENGDYIAFAYTGAFPTPPEPKFTTIDLSAVANMNISDQAGKGYMSWMNETLEGNDIKGMPTGKQTYDGVPFVISSPDKNGNKVAAAVSNQDGFPKEISVLVNQNAGAVYLLHAANKVGSAEIAGAVIFEYEDGSQSFEYIQKGKHLTGWWGPSLKSNVGGVGWRGPNKHTLDVGVEWVAIENPSPEKKIKNIVFKASLNQSVYAVLGLTLSTVPHYVRPKAVSYGGPDNWAAGIAMGAFIDGLCGVQDNNYKYENAHICPRWVTTESDSVNVTVRYGASDGYVKYVFLHDDKSKAISMDLTGSGEKADFHVLLPKGITSVKSVSLDGKEIESAISQMESSSYVDFNLTKLSPQKILIQY